MKRILALLCIVFTLSPSASNASFLDFLGYGRAVDKTAGELRSVIDHAKASARTLTSEGDAVLRDRIDQIDGVVDRAIARVENLTEKTEESILEILETAKADVSQLEAQFFVDLNAAIDSAVCEGRVFTLGDLKDTAGKFGELLGTHTIIISPLIPRAVKQPSWWRRQILGKSKPNEFDIKTPFSATYDEIRIFVEDNISNIGDNDDAKLIVRAYNLLGLYAKKAACFEAVNKEAMFREIKRLKTLADNWEAVLNVEIN